MAFTRVVRFTHFYLTFRNKISSDYSVIDIVSGHLLIDLEYTDDIILFVEDADHLRQQCKQVL